MADIRSINGNPVRGDFVNKSEVRGYLGDRGMFVFPSGTSYNPPQQSAAIPWRIAVDSSAVQPTIAICSAIGGTVYSFTLDDIFEAVGDDNTYTDASDVKWVNLVSGHLVFDTQSHELKTKSLSAGLTDTEVAVLTQYYMQMHVGGLLGAKFNDEINRRWTDMRFNSVQDYAENRMVEFAYLSDNGMFIAGPTSGTKLLFTWMSTTNGGWLNENSRMTIKRGSATVKTSYPSDVKADIGSEHVETVDGVEFISLASGESLVYVGSTRKFAVVSGLVSLGDKKNDIVLIANTGFRSVFGGLYGNQLMNDMYHMVHGGVIAFYVALSGDIEYRNSSGATLIRWDNHIVPKYKNVVITESLTIDNICAELPAANVAVVDGKKYIKIPSGQVLYYSVATAKVFMKVPDVQASLCAIPLIRSQWEQITGGVLFEKYLNDKIDNASSGGIDDTTIIGLNADVKPKLTQLVRRRNAGAGTFSDLPPLLTLLHFSDIHGNGTNLARMQQFKSAYSSLIHDSICTGDIKAWWNGSSMDFWANQDGTTLTCIGNHDVVNQVSPYDWHNLISQQDAYNIFIAPYYQSWGSGVTVVEGHTYYYKDYADCEIRLIVLDCMIQGADEVSEQNSWFQSALAGAKTLGYAVVCAEHVPPLNHRVIDCTFTSKDKNIYYVDDNYYLREVYQASVDAFMQDGGEFTCWLCGHTHYDIVTYNNNYPAQVFVAVTTAQPEQTYDTSARVIGDKSQDAFNVVSIDTASNYIKIVRVGADRDNLMRHKGTLVLDYSTTPASVVYND